MRVFRAIGSFFDFLRSPRHPRSTSPNLQREAEQARARLRNGREPGPTGIGGW